LQQIQWQIEHTNLGLSLSEKIARGLRFAYDTKLVAMATSLEESEKNGPDQENSPNYVPFGKKIVKIGPVDTEIALLIVKKKKKRRN